MSRRQMTLDASAQDSLLSEVFDYVEALKALGDPIRLEMVRRMARQPELPCYVIESELGLRKTTIAYHVRILRNARLIQIRREGEQYHYSLLTGVWEYFLPGLLEVFAGRHQAARLLDPKPR